MREIKGDAWALFNSLNDAALCITTNGTLKKDGTGVMGAGIAKEAKERFPGIDQILGREVARYGNTLNYLGGNLFAFPVKHNWYEKADINLIIKSAKDLYLHINYTDDPYAVYILPRPGCGNGKLDWETEVKPAIKDILPDNVWVITNV